MAAYGLGINDTNTAALDPYSRYQLNKRRASGEPDWPQLGDMQAAPDRGGSALGGLRTAMGGGDEAPGAGLMRRLTASPDVASQYGLIADPETLAATNAATRHQAEEISNPKPAITGELEREDIQNRAAGALQGLKSQFTGQDEHLLDVQSERAAERRNLPWAAHNLYEDRQAQQQARETQFLQPEMLRAASVGDTADAAMAGHQATAAAAQKDAAIRGLASAFEAESKARAGGHQTISDPDYFNLYQRLTQIQHQDVKK